MARVTVEDCLEKVNNRFALVILGAERARHSYAWKDFLALGVPLCFGTDYPVEPITPFRGLYAAVTRKNETGSKEYFPEQKITIEQPKVKKVPVRKTVSV